MKLGVLWVKFTLHCSVLLSPFSADLGGGGGGSLRPYALGQLS
jgi:hypothetical protein